MKEEIFTPIVGYEDFYEISNHGRIRSVDGRIMKLDLDRSDYLTIRLTRFSVRKKLAVHRLVFEHFNEALLPGEIVHHIDEDKLNNCAWNLMKVTTSEHRIIHSKKLKPIYVTL